MCKHADCYRPIYEAQRHRREDAIGSRRYTCSRHIQPQADFPVRTCRRQVGAPQKQPDQKTGADRHNDERCEYKSSRTEWYAQPRDVDSAVQNVTTGYEVHAGANRDQPEFGADVKSHGHSAEQACYEGGTEGLPIAPTSRLANHRLAKAPIAQLSASNESACHCRAPKIKANETPLAILAPAKRRALEGGVMEAICIARADALSSERPAIKASTIPRTATTRLVAIEIGALRLRLAH
jgi:hypothetical protein